MSNESGKKHAETNWDTCYKSLSDRRDEAAKNELERTLGDKDQPNYAFNFDWDNTIQYNTLLIHSY